MFNPNELKYHLSHTWLKAEGANVYAVGITGHAQEALGDVVYVELPAAGSAVKQGEACGVIDSVKTAADVHAPASGVIIAVNTALADTPEAVNTDPDGAWLFRMTLSDPTELAVLLDATAYEKALA